MGKEEGRTIEARRREAVRINGSRTQTDRALENPCGDITDLMQWKHERNGSKHAPQLAPGWREKVRGFTRKEKQAVILGMLLSDGVGDEQLNKAIEALMDGN